MGKTRDLFQKIRATKGTVHAKMDTIKDRNGSRKYEEYTELYKKDPCDPGNHDGVITHLQSDME